MEAYWHGVTIFEIVESLASRLDVTAPRIPRLCEAPAEAARLTRAALGESPDRPIQHLIYAIERIGGYVFALPSDLERRDAFSTWTQQEPRLPVICTVRDRPGDRLRFSVAHELGHLVLHDQLLGSRVDIEREADEFAAELLMPSAAMLQEIAPPFTLSMFASMKLRWRVAIQALVRRAKDLDLITDRQYRYLFEQIAVRGWRTREPAQLDVPVEKPRAVRKMAELLYGDPIDYRRLAADVSLTPTLVREILEAHADRHELTVILADDRVQQRRHLRSLDFAPRRYGRPRQSDEEAE
jgi:Zn-dependent peptidase ImmA (M78 family)